VHIGDARNEKVRITVIDYDEHEFQERTVENVEDCFAFRDTPTVTWINVDGIHDIELIEKLGAHFGLHPILIEDIANANQRPKMEDYNELISVVIKMLYFDSKDEHVLSEHLVIIFGSNFVISFQEPDGDVFDCVRERIRNSKSRIRKMGADHLAYCLIDAVVDNYFTILEKIGEKIETAEEHIIDMPGTSALQEIYGYKREMIYLRKSVWPLREVIGGLERIESPLIHKATKIYLRDLYDHTIQIMDTVETFRDMLSGMLDVYLSSVSNKLNEVMKVLTIIATIFIPLTFIAGVYGMNFRYMPELAWRAGYFIVLGLMAVVAIVMIVYFRRKKWI